MREKTANKLKASLALFPPTPWKELEGKPSLVSGKGAGGAPDPRSRAMGETQEARTPCLRDLQAEEGKVENL